MKTIRHALAALLIWGGTWALVAGLWLATDRETVTKLLDRISDGLAAPNAPEPTTEQQDAAPDALWH